MPSTLRFLGASALAFPLAASIAACSSDPAPIHGAGAPLTISAQQVYSGFDGTHKYRVPLGVSGGGSDLKITASDPNLVQFDKTHLITPEGDTSTYFFVTTKGAGDVTITATSEGHTVTTKVTIVAYPAADYAIGEQRYVNGEGGDPPCLTCHGEMGGIDHSPTKLAPVSDANALRAILTGVLPSGDPVPTPKHSWKVTEAEKSGLLTYLRAIPPKGFEGAK